jgi:Na+-transporting NADH:ubiquinone oxidoreductase subunit NqrD
MEYSGFTGVLISSLMLVGAARAFARKANPTRSLA